MGKLTKGQIENLQHVLDHGRPKPRSNAGYHCRVKGLTEFVWLYEDGTIASTSEKEPQEGAWLVKVAGERLTDAGREALSKAKEGKE